MGFTNQERINLNSKVLAASVIDANESAQWYESRLQNEFTLGANKVLLDLGTIRQYPAANKTTAQSNAAGPLAGIVDDLSDDGYAVRLTPIPGAAGTYVALETYGDFTSTRLEDWIQPQTVPQSSGAASIGYTIELYDGQPGAGGTLVNVTDGTTGTGSSKSVGWIFNYSLGILLLSADFRGSVSDPWIKGFRYIGDTVENIPRDGYVAVQEIFTASPAQTDFVLANEPDPNTLMVWDSGVKLSPVTDYIVIGNTVEMTAPMNNNEIVHIFYFTSSNGTITVNPVSGAASVLPYQDDIVATSIGQNTFSLTHLPLGSSRVMMFINKLKQEITDYSVLGSTVTYTGSYEVVPGDKIEFWYPYITVPLAIAPQSLRDVLQVDNKTDGYSIETTSGDEIHGQDTVGGDLVLRGGTNSSGDGGSVVITGGTASGGTDGYIELTAPLVNVTGDGYVSGTWEASAIFDGSGPVNVKKFGAVGDGVVDDTDSIKRAIEYAIGIPSGNLDDPAEGDASYLYGSRIQRPVYFPPGNYRTTSTITIRYQGVSLIGPPSSAQGGFQGAAATIVGDFTGTMFRLYTGPNAEFSGARDLSFQDLMLKFVTKTAGKVLVAVGGGDVSGDGWTSGLAFKNCRLNLGDIGIEIESTYSNSAFARLSIIGTLIDNCNYGIQANSKHLSNSIILDSRITQNTNAGLLSGFTSTAIQSVNFEGNGSDAFRVAATNSYGNSFGPLYFEGITSGLACLNIGLSRDTDVGGIQTSGTITVPLVRVTNSRDIRAPGKDIVPVSAVDCIFRRILIPDNGDEDDFAAAWNLNRAGTAVARVSKLSFDTTLNGSVSHTESIDFGEGVADAIQVGTVAVPEARDFWTWTDDWLDGNLYMIAYAIRYDAGRGPHSSNSSLLLHARRQSDGIYEQAASIAISNLTEFEDGDVLQIIAVFRNSAGYDYNAIRPYIYPYGTTTGHTHYDGYVSKVIGGQIIGGADVYIPPFNVPKLVANDVLDVNYSYEEIDGYTSISVVPETGREHVVGVDTSDPSWNDLDTVTIPSSPNTLSKYTIADIGDNASSKRIRIDPNGYNISGRAGTIDISIDGGSYTFLFNGTQYVLIG